MRGRKPRPTLLRELEGNLGRRPIRRATQPAANLVEPPAWLNTDQREVWRYVIDNVPLGLLKTLDRGTLAVWVVAESMHREAVRKVSEVGMVVRSPQQGIPIQNPYLPIVNRQAVIMLRAAAELGFTPASRARVQADPLPLFAGVDDAADAEELEEAADEASAAQLLPPPGADP